MGPGLSPAGALPLSPSHSLPLELSQAGWAARLLPSGGNKTLPQPYNPYPSPTTPIPALQPLPHILLLTSSGLLLPPGSPPSSLPAASPSFPSRLVPSSLSRCPRCSRIGDRGRISAAAHLHPASSPASSSPPFPEPPPPPGTGAQRGGEP